MNGTSYLIDTNAVIYFLSGNECMKSYINSSFFVSDITEMELLSYSRLTSEEENMIKTFISKCKVLSIDESIKEKAIWLRKKYSIKLPDAIIAATSIDKSVGLITADKGFMKIEELQLELIEPL